MANTRAAKRKIASSSAIALSRDSLFALITSLVCAEIETIRRKEFDADAVAAWPEAMPLGAGGLEMNSIELMQVSGVADEFFHLHETGVEEYSKVSVMMSRSVTKTNGAYTYWVFVKRM